jgi:hypothetical protein
MPNPATPQVRGQREIQQPGKIPDCMLMGLDQAIMRQTLML